MKNQKWEDYENAARRGPMAFGAKLLWAFIVIAVVISVVGVGLNFFGFFTGAANNAIDVAKKEFYPEALLKKYEWFKNAVAELDKKRADIQLYEGRFKRLEGAYQGTPRGQWPRDDREQWGLWQSEVAGVKASYNSLAAQYNAQMAKANWAFTNVGDLPPGATEPLPREFRSYVTE